MLNLARPRRARRPGLTPMIDVVFLLLVFFMLAARFGINPSQPITGGSGGAATGDAPRLVAVGPAGLRLNGVAIGPAALVSRLRALTGGGRKTVVLRPDEGVDVQRLIDVISLLRDAGFGDLALVE